MNPFDMVTSLSYSKDYIFNEDTKKEYIPYIVNKSFSFFADSVFYADAMNSIKTVDLNLQYDFYFYSIPAKKRYTGKWYKNENAKDLETIKKIYQVNDTKAKDILKILTKDQMKYLNNISGGAKGSSL